MILPNGPKRIGKQREVSVKGEEVIVVQAKASRLGTYLLGQALFSKDLMKRCGAKPIKSIALCSVDDDVLRPLAERRGIEVIVDRKPQERARRQPTRAARP